MFIVELAILIYSVILHEIAHGFVADKLGDPTARLARRLTLDPRPHIDPLMTLILPLLMFLSHTGIIFGAAKPVPIDPFNFRDVKKDTALVALAGPLTNILIAAIFALLLKLSFLIIINSSLLSFAQEVFLTAITWNVGLAIFNLVPLPPLDGFKVLAGLVSDDLANEMYRLERYGFVIIFAVLIFFPNVLFGLIGPIIHNLTSILLR